jgi:hypothetical protein
LSIYTYSINEYSLIECVDLGRHVRAAETAQVPDTRSRVLGAEDVPYGFKYRRDLPGHLIGGAYGWGPGKDLDLPPQCYKVLRQLTGSQPG